MRKRLVIAVAAAVVIALGVALWALGVGTARPADTDFRRLAVVCRGQTPAGAPSFVVWGPVHRVVAIEDRDAHVVRPDLVPVANRSDAVATTEIVLCLGARTTQTIESCGATARTRVVREIRAMSPSTGGVLARGTVDGPSPQACGAAGGETSGREPGATEIGAWLVAHVPSSLR